MTATEAFSPIECVVVDRELPSVLESVGIARDLARSGVPPAVRADVALVVSELVANAVKHGCGPVGVRVTTNRHRVRIAVTDASPHLPRIGGSGYGMHVVARLAVASGVDTNHTGKTVWAELAE
jgi:anti-sigma regulatory factor (Ser/Thr protein kinase)